VCKNLIVRIIACECEIWPRIVTEKSCVSEGNSEGNILSRRDVVIEEWVRLGTYERNKHVFT
jgi:hypothetical protein